MSTKIWKNTNESYFFEQLASNNSIWLEIQDGKIIYKFEIYETNNQEITLFDSSRSIYVKLGPTDAQFTYSLEKPFLIFQYGTWLVSLEYDASM